MNLVDRIENYWSKRSDDFFDLRIEELKSDKRQLWQDEIIANLPDKEHLKILDVGCGPGFFSVILSSLGHDVIGIDLTESMIQKADEIADILDELDDDEREKILVNLETEDAEEVKELLKYEDETVGSIMSKDFISFNLDITIGEIIDILRESNPEDEELNSIFIKDEEERVIGIIELKDLILNNGNVKVKEIMDENINSLKHTESINEAVEIASKYDLLAIPVVDNNEVLIGVVNTHDLIDEVLYPMWKKKNK